MNNTKQNGSIIAIITMMFLYAMISFVTNLAAPIGVIWKNIFGGESANTVGMLGNAMNFLAYFFMGIPAGKMLVRVGYKKTALHWFLRRTDSVLLGLLYRCEDYRICYLSFRSVHLWFLCLYAEHSG